MQSFVAEPIERPDFLRNNGGTVSFLESDVFSSISNEITVLYTGSGNVGKIVATAAAKTLTPTTLEVRHTLIEFDMRKPLTKL